MKKLVLIVLALILSTQVMYSRNDYAKQRVEAFKKVKLETDLSRLTANEQKMIPILIEISKIMDDLFWKQNFGDKEKFLSGLNDDYEKQFALINYGPWDQLNDEKPFIQGFGGKPAGANFYPVEMTKSDFEKIKDPLKLSPYSIIVKDGGEYKVVMYSKAYEKELKKAAELLKQASELAEDAGLKKYLKIRF